MRMRKNSSAWKGETWRRTKMNLTWNAIKVKRKRGTTEVGNWKVKALTRRGKVRTRAWVVKALLKPRSSQ